VQQQVIDISDAHLANIFNLAKLAESRNYDIGKHLERVRTFCRLLSVKLSRNPRYEKEIDPEFTSNIYNASPLHDIGKAVIPEEILVKRGKLTREEFDIMKSHADQGARTLEAMRLEYPENSFLAMGIAITRHHHERWDGGGYPQGLSGEEIPLSARIMAVADVYDALRSVRCYKPAYTHEHSADFIMRESGTHFDPQIVEAFSELSDDFRESRERMDD
jgi:putative two-component system response regulator